MKFVNLTPHAVTIRTKEQDLVLPSSGVARVAQGAGRETEVGGVRVVIPGPWGQVEGLPDAQEGIGLVVSALVGGRLEGSGREDVFTLGTGPQDGAIRNEMNQIIAVTCLKQVR